MSLIYWLDEFYLCYSIRGWGCKGKEGRCGMYSCENVERNWLWKECIWIVFYNISFC